jgi:Flp pilus assembly pilin Flp
MMLTWTLERIPARAVSARAMSARLKEDESMTTETIRPRTEEFRITGDELLAKVKQIIHEGNIRRVMIKNETGTTLVEIPLTVGLVGVALLPVWAAVGAIAALATDCTIVVERRD